MRTLINHGADCDAQNKHWQTSLHICALSSDASCASYIIGNVRNIDTTDEYGLTPLHYAVSFQSYLFFFFFHMKLFLLINLVYDWKY